VKISTVEFLRSAVSPNDYPSAFMSEIAFIGRSNVGKSSALNQFTQKKTAKISATPGKTRTLNFFKINDKFILVDFPGYGFAKVSKSERDQWKLFIEDYLRDRKTLKLVVLLRDISIPESPLDEQMSQWLSHHAIPFIDVYTKFDKLKSKEVGNKMAYLTHKHGQAFLVVSSKTGKGFDQLWKFVEQALNEKKQPTI
jgi:GTP-binding protein